MTGTPLRLAETLLFVPGNRPERFGRAFASGADAVIIDWEDAVSDNEKDSARRLTSEHASERDFVLRLNAATSTHFHADLEAVAALSKTHPLRGVIMSKVESDLGIAEVRLAAHEQVAIIALIESAAGLAAMPTLASDGRISRFAFGALDLAAGLGVPLDSPTLDHARSQVVLSSHAQDLPAPIDSPSPEFRKGAVVERAASHARKLGFGGMLCIHPSQLLFVRAGFEPSKKEREWAREVLAQAEGNATGLGGTMVDRPVIARAKRIIERETAFEGREHPYDA